MAKRRRGALFPLPVDELFHHPKWVEFPASARGMTITLLEHFWRSGCAPLKVTSNTIYPLVRVHSATWHSYRDQIMALFTELRPGLEAAYHQKSAGLAGLRIAATHSAAAKRASAAAQRFENTAPARLAPTELGLAPVKAPTSQGAPPRPRPPDQRPARPRLVDRGR